MMNRKTYSQILDSLARDNLHANTDLAPRILARIQKGKEKTMQPRMKVFAIAFLLLLVFVIVLVSVPSVAAAIQRWFGYVPGIGLVHDGQIRVLAEPVSVTREGVTVTVDQVVINQERTALLYSVDGIPSAVEDAQSGETLCGMESYPYIVSLHLPDSDPLLASPNGVQSWPSGYQHRFNYPSVPAAVNDAKLVISCLFHTREGAVPENWEIPMHFAPAPPDMTVFPVIEIAPTTVPVVTVTPVTSATEGDAALTLSLDRAVQMDDGYLLYATLHWEETSFASVDVTDPTETLHLLDGDGQEIVSELYYDEYTGVNWDQRQTVFAVKTAPMQVPGPLTLSLDAVLVQLPVNASFVFDPGLDPEPGQQWQPDLEVELGERRLIVRSVTVEEGGGYSFEMSSDTGIQIAVLSDFEHPIISGYEGEGSSNGQENIFFSCFYYANGLPDGSITVTVGSIGVKHIQQLQVQWIPPVN